MHVRPETHVISQVPADVIRIVIDRDLIGVPQPVAAVADVHRGNAEVEPAEPEAAWTSAAQPPNVPSADSAREPPVLERMIQVIPRIVRSAIVPDPFIAGSVYVRR